jgi:1-acyl-sn-glycerol-3-phosphate acyltransferase
VYGLISRITGLALDIFYDRRHIRGDIPADGPLLIVANHQNALVDPVAIARIARRKVCFLAKEPLFHTPIIKYFVKGMGALPVYRAQDGHDTSQNERTFAAVYDALARGEAVALFPEGISHDLPSVQRMKTGAARMAMGAEERFDWDLGVKIIPVGLTWRDKTKFRSDLVSQAGEVMSVAEFRDEEDERAGVVALTDAIGEGIRSLTTNMEEHEDQALLELAEKIYDTEGERRVERVRYLSDRANQLREKDPERLELLRDRVAAFRGTLDRLGLVADHLEARPSLGLVAGFALRNLVALLVGLPVSIVGALTYGLPYLFVRRVAAMMAPKVDVDEIAGIKIMVSLPVFPLWQAALSALLIWRLGAGVGVALSVALPFAGLYAHHFVRKRHRAWLDARTFFALTFSRRLRRNLEAERDAIAGEMASVAEFLDADTPEADGAAPAS